MPLFVKLGSFARNLFFSRRVEADLDQEIRGHLQMLTEENVRAGILAEAAQATGDMAAATQRYQQFLEVWQNAGINRPEVATAKEFLAKHQ